MGKWQIHNPLHEVAIKQEAYVGPVINYPELTVDQHNIWEKLNKTLTEFGYPILDHMVANNDDSSYHRSWFVVTNSDMSIAWCKKGKITRSTNIYTVKDKIPDFIFLREPEEYL